MKNITLFLLIFFYVPLIASDTINIKVCNNTDVSIYVDIRNGLCASHDGSIVPSSCNNWNVEVGGHYCSSAGGKIWFTPEIYAPFDWPHSMDVIYSANKDDHGYYVDQETRDKQFFLRTRAHK